MRRREFITLLGGASVPVLFPLAARAQQPKLPTIGVLGAGTSVSQKPWTDAFSGRLRELGWVDGRTIAIEYRWAEGRFDRSPDIFAEFVRRNVDIIVTHATANVRAAKQATATIPIVFASAGDPVGTGLVPSLSHPGGNVTGLSIVAPDVAGKRLELARDLVPGLSRVAGLANAVNPVTAPEMAELETAARTLGVEVLRADVRRGEEIAPTIAAFSGRVEAVYVQVDALMTSYQTQLNALALAARLPTLHGVRDYVASGGLMSYGTDFADLFRRAADYVDKILRGAKPADLPVEQPTKFELVVNLKTAKALGLKIPEAFLLRADEVIE